MKRLGDYIRPVDVRNRDLKVTRLLGVSISKEFMPSIANTIGTDMSNYKIVTPGQFVYIADTSRRGDKIAIALLSRKEASSLVSAIYTVFEVINENELDPEYLMMWFRRPEFDRYARFHSHGSAREVFDWDEMCEVRLPIPPIERQREAVAEYSAIGNRIATNKRLIATLEETARAIYRRTFVEGIDPSNLPAGWRMGTLGEVANISSGKTCSNKKDEPSDEYKFPVAGASGIIGYSNTFNQEKKLLTTGRVGTLGVVKRYKGKIFAADNVLVIETEHYEFCFQALNHLDYTTITKGGVQSLITQTDLKNIPIVIPPKPTLNAFENECSKLFEFKELKEKENQTLTQMQTILLAKMGM